MVITRNALALSYQRSYRFDDQSDEDISGEQSFQEGDDQDEHIDDHDEEDSTNDEDDSTSSDDDEEEELIVHPKKKQKKDVTIAPTISGVDDPEGSSTSDATSPGSPSTTTTSATPVGEENNHQQSIRVNDTPTTPNMNQLFLLNGDQTDEDDEDDVIVLSDYSSAVSDALEPIIATYVTESLLLPLECLSTFNCTNSEVDEPVPTIMPDTITSPHNENQPEQYHNLNQDDVEDDELIELDASSLNFDEEIPTTTIATSPATLFDNITRGPIGSCYRPSKISIVTEQVQKLLQQDPTLAITTKEEQVEEENNLVLGASSNGGNKLETLQSLFANAIVDADDLLFVEKYMRLGPIAKRLIRRQFNQVEKFWSKVKNNDDNNIG